MFYAADGHYDSETDDGILSVERVLSFATEAERDAYVEAVEGECLRRESSMGVLAASEDEVRSLAPECPLIWSMDDVDVRGLDKASMTRLYGEESSYVWDF